jgi:hypothetical protein
MKEVSDIALTSFLKMKIAKAISSYNEARQAP